MPEQTQLDERVVLGREFRNAVMDGEHPRLTFPRHTPKTLVRRECPVEPGQLVELTSKVAIRINSVTSGLHDYVVGYEILDERGSQLGRVVGYSNSDAGAIQTRQAPAPGIPGERYSGQFRPEKEPEAVLRKEATSMAEEIRRDAIDRLEDKRRGLVATGRELKEMGISDWGIQKQLDKIDERVLRLRATSGLTA